MHVVPYNTTSEHLDRKLFEFKSLGKNIKKLETVWSKIYNIANTHFDRSSFECFYEFLFEGLEKLLKGWKRFGLKAKIKATAL